MSTKEQEKDGASPYVSIYLPRTQAEALAKHLNDARPRRTWDAVAKNIMRALQQNAGRRKYALDGTYTVKDEP